ncbi:serine hydrolase [Occallatibacter riparius]|uniref:Serine hydrolase n=1 Tax=Occallatibacter riparius TaxID=1002689 RepID=A0A9J7BYW0_9BACT|nr:serine hydrolase [Occallatibacter riparius]UWZ86630.1 serine hydrolase [Occallatibacter riparius]
MHSLFRFAAIVCAGAALSAGFAAQNAAATSRVDPAAKADAAASADQYLRAWADQGRFAGTVLIAKGDKILLRKGYGLANYQGKVPNAPETVFRIGSITKMFTAFGILQLEEKGKLSVNDPVVKYVPEIPAAWSAITIHQLLCHKSGIPDFVNAKAYGAFNQPHAVENAIREYADKPLVNAPGATLRYSNSGYVLLGRVIEKVSGKPYDEYITENILKPAGMTHTGMDPTREPKANLANGYRWDGEEVVNAPFSQPDYSPAGGLMSTVDDMYRFDRALKAGTLFSKAIMEKAWGSYGRWTAPPPIPMEADYGYGWMTGNDFGHKWVGHGGWVNGFVSEFNRYPDDDMVVIVLWNFETSNHMIVNRDLEAILFGAPFEMPKAQPIVHPKVETLARYVGNYQLGPMTVQITLKNGRLYAFAPGQPTPYGLVAVSDTEFYCNDAPTQLRFVPDEKGTAGQIVLNLMGREMTAVRAAGTPGL